MKKKTVLLVSDFYYRASGRDYFREDIELSAFLRDYFKVWIAHISDIAQAVGQADAVLVRNTGPLKDHRVQLDQLKSLNLTVSNDLKGKADLCGKQYLLDLFAESYPVIPTVRTIEEISILGDTEKLFVKSPRHKCARLLR